MEDTEFEGMVKGNSLFNIYMCVCVCVCVHTHTYIYIYDILGIT